MRKGVPAAGNWIVDQVKCIVCWSGEGYLCSIFSEERTLGGGPANRLFDLSIIDLDYPLRATGRNGEDANGNLLLTETGRRGIEGSPLPRTPGAPTSRADVMSGPSSRTFFYAPGALYSFARRLPFDAMLRAGVASSYFKQKSPPVLGGAVSFSRIEEHLKSCEFGLV